jgi:Tfp pilus assembly protein PilN
MDITKQSNFPDASSQRENQEDKRFKLIIAVISLVQTFFFLLVYSILTCKAMRELRGVKLERSSVVTILVFLLSEAASLINSIAYVVLQQTGFGNNFDIFKVTDIIT